MATTIITKNGSGAPVAGDLVQGELAVDLTNKTLYSKDSSGNVFKVGDTGGGSPGTFTDLVATDSFTSPGIDDNATSTAITIDSNEYVGIGSTNPESLLTIQGNSPAITVNATDNNNPRIELARDASVNNWRMVNDAAVLKHQFGDDSTSWQEAYRVTTGQYHYWNDGQLLLTQDGRVGIGTNSPAAPFEVNDGTQTAGLADAMAPDVLIRGTGDTGLSIFTDATSTAAIAFGKQAVSSRARWIKVDNSEDTLEFGRGESDADLTIDSSGHVGIGQTNPAHILDLKDATPVINIEHAAGNSARIYFDDATDGVWGAINANYGSGGSAKEIKIAPNSSTGDSRFGGMSVKKDVVKVGGDFQQTSLEVNDDITVTGAGKQISVDDTGANGVQAYMTAQSNVGGFIASRDAPNSSEVRLEARGNVGSLTMTGRDGLSTEMQCSSGGNLVFNMDGTQKATLSQEGTFTAERLVSNANIKVEGTYPAFDLIDTDAALGLGTRMVQTGDTFLMNTLSSSGSYIEDIYKVNMNANGPTLHTWTTESTGTAMTLTNAGRLGIGTSSPAVKLDVQTGAINSEVLGLRGFYADRGLSVSVLSDTVTGTSDAIVDFNNEQAVNGAFTWSFEGDEKVRIDESGNLLVGRTSVTAGTTDFGWQATNAGIVFQYANASGSSDVHRWHNGAGSVIATLNARGEAFFLGGSTFSGTVTADKVVQDGAPVIDTLQIIRAFMKLRAATADPDSTVDELREKLSTAVDDIIDQFQDQIDNLDLP